MKKFLLSFLLATSVFSQGDPPPYVKGQSASGLGNLGSTIQVPKNQSTKLNSYQARIETGNPNELRNPSFEGSPYNSGWTCPTGTISQAVGPDGFKALGIVSSGAGFECNQTFTSTADLKGTLARFFARVKTSSPNTFVCGLDGGSAAGNRVNCQKVSLTNADKVFSETSGFFNYGNMVYGIAIYSTDTAAFPTVIDEVSMGAAGLTTATIQGDTVYSAEGNTTSGTIFNQNSPNGPLLASCTAVNPTVCLFSSSRFSVKPNCWVSPTGTSIAKFSISGLSASGITIGSYDSKTDALLASQPFTIGCEKTGADYANSSSSGILSSNADFAPIPITYTLTNAGNATVTGTISRQGSKATFNGKILIGTTPPTGNIQLNIPAAYPLAKVSTFQLSTVSGFAASTIYGGMAYSNSTGSFTFYGPNTAGISWTTTVPGTWTSASSNYIEFNIVSEISGWTQSPLAIIPLAGTSTTPGYSGQVDDLVFAFGDTSSTPCTTGTCAYLRQAGNGIVKVDFAGTGAYTINTRRSYNLIFCTGSLTGTSYTIGFQGSGAGPGNSFTIQTGQSISNLNSWGTLFCKGYY